MALPDPNGKAVTAAAGLLGSEVYNRGTVEARARQISINVETERGGRRKFTFDDGSTLIVDGNKWDWGIVGRSCMCFHGMGHDDVCSLALPLGSTD